MDRVALLRKQARDKLAQAKTLLEVGELTDEKQRQVDELLGQAEGLEKQAAQLERVLKAEEKSAEGQVEEQKRGAAVVKDAADQEFEDDREFLRAVKNAAIDPQHADVRLKSRKATGMSEDDPSLGGYLVPKTTSTRILERMYTTGEILSRVSRDPVTGNSMTYNGIDETSRVDGSRYGGLNAGWLNEGGTLSGGKPKFSQIELKLRKLGALVYATEEQLEDIHNLASFIMRVVPEELKFRAEDAVIEGIGGGMPLGLLNAPGLVTVTRTDASKILFADVVNMWARRWAGAKDYAWFINQDCTPMLDQMVIGTEAPPRFVDYGVDGVMRMKGRPVIELEYCQTMGTKGDIILASMSQYQVIDKGDVKQAASIHVQFTTDEMTYKFIYRVDGKPIWRSPLTPLHGSSTVSPYVMLSSASS